MHWKVFLATATGKHHLDADLPCQDAGHYLVVDGNLVGVVCDGAGSAAQGHEGAQRFATRLAARLAARLEAGSLAPQDAAGARTAIHDAIAAERDSLELEAAARGLVLRDFACTLVGCVAGRKGGCFFHIGDGFAIHRRGDGVSVLSAPENGEFADETYFVTDTSWQEHLRVTPLAAARPGCLIGLMSDGTSPFAVDRPRTGFFAPFIEPVLRFLRQAGEADGSLALRRLLEDEQTFAITTDDKTLLLALAA
jgi:hypothetical protein